MLGVKCIISTIITLNCCVYHILVCITTANNGFQNVYKYIYLIYKIYLKTENVGQAFALVVCLICQKSH